MQQTIISFPLRSISRFPGGNRTTDPGARPMVGHVLWLTIGLCVFSLMSFAQETAPDPRETVFTVVEQRPEYPGGSQALKNYLAMQVHYPDSAAKARIAGNVLISFVVEPDGQLTQLVILRGLGYGCDEEAIRVIKAMPRWLPGRQSGRAIRVKYNLPVAFGVK